jgi:adenylate cyclase
VRRRKSTTTRRSVIIAAGILPVLLVALLKFANPTPMAALGSMVFDSYQRLSPRPFQDAGVRIVDIDDESIRRLGQWPWPRSDIAALTQTIANAGAGRYRLRRRLLRTRPHVACRIAQWATTQGAAANQVTALRSLPEPDAQFAATLQQTPSVLGFFLTNDRSRAGSNPKPASQWPAPIPAPASLPIAARSCRWPISQHPRTGWVSCRRAETPTASSAVRR